MKKKPIKKPKQDIQTLTDPPTPPPIPPGSGNK